MQDLKQLDEKSLKEEFQHFADKKKDENSAAKEASRDALDNYRMSKKGLAALCAVRKKTLTEGEVKKLMMKIDTSGDGEVSTGTSRSAAGASLEPTDVISRNMCGFRGCHALRGGGQSISCD